MVRDRARARRCKFEIGNERLEAKDGFQRGLGETESPERLGFEAAAARACWAGRRPFAAPR